MASFDYTVPGTVPVLTQPTSNTCWATVATMLFSWRDNVTYTIPHVMDLIGSNYRSLFDLNSRLANADEANFLASAGLVGEAPANYSIDSYLAFLQGFGPLWITLNVDSTNIFSFHAVVMTGMFGDGTPDATYVVLNDPENGTDYADPFNDFVQKFERVAGLPGDPILQVIHF